MLMLFNTSCVTDGGSPNGKIAPGDLQHDFATMTELVETSSPYPFYMTSRASYDDLKASIKDRLKDSMSSLEFFQIVYPLVKSLKNPHYNLAAAMAPADASIPVYFPFSVFITGDSIVIDEHLAAPADQSLRGKYVSAINGRKPGDILSQLRQGVEYSAAEIPYINYTMESSFGKLLHSLSGISGKFNIEVDGRSYAFDGVPLGLLKGKETQGSIHDSIIQAEQEQIGYLKIRDLNPGNAEEWDEKLPVFFRKLRQLKVRKLIIDMRDNYGGSTALTRKLIAYISSKEYSFGDEVSYSKDAEIIHDSAPPVAPKSVSDKFDGACILLVNAGTFSSAHMFFAAFKHYGMGITVGEPGIERYLISGELKEKELERTKCMFYYPTSNFMLPGFSETVNAPVIPDVVISGSMQDRIARKDNVLDSIVSPGHVK
ncbi:S41 family peptidase [Chitinophaga caseinilytica]|uniref:S41 family peptidase n=1 Tax=Chitinophaga caseinilytica TaxID=2267521 RepID=A0ABZ2ZB92_9BACT